MRAHLQSPNVENSDPIPDLQVHEYQTAPKLRPDVEPLLGSGQARDVLDRAGLNASEHRHQNSEAASEVPERVHQVGCAGEAVLVEGGPSPYSEGA